MSTTVRIATRKSPLAIWQAEHVATALQQAHPGLEVELVRMSTKGDRVLDSPLAKIGGKGLFVKELEQGMLEGHADIAVHSMKDVPVGFPEGLHLAAIMDREDPRDAFVSGKFENLDALPEGAVVGTSSLRRQCQIGEQRPDLRLKDLRGNVNTRLRKLDAGEYDAIILASAGLKRLGFTDRITAILSAEQILPAIGQGAVGIEARSDDARINDLIKPLNHQETWTRVAAERAMNERLNGGCQVPLAGFAEITGTHLRMRGLVGSPDGAQMIRGEVEGNVEDAVILGISLADDLLARGAGAILEALYRSS